MSHLCIQLAVTIVGIQVIQNNLVEIFLPSVSSRFIANILSFILSAVVCDCLIIGLGV